MTDPMIGENPSGVAVPKTAAWEDVLDIYYAPRQVFERRRDGKYIIPILVLCVVSMLIFVLSAQINEALQDAEFARVIRQNGMTAEQAAGAKAMGKKFAALAIYLIPVFVAIGAWVSGLIIMLLGNAMGGKLNYAQATAIAVFGSMPELLGRTLMGVQGMFLDTAKIVHRYSFSLSAARFLPADANNWALKACSLLDPFVLWGLFLVGFGAFIIGRMEKEKAAVLAVVVALVGAALFR
jgi:Yip1 domain